MDGGLEEYSMVRKDHVRHVLLHVGCDTVVHVGYWKDWMDGTWGNWEMRYVCKHQDNIPLEAPVNMMTISFDSLIL